VCESGKNLLRELLRPKFYKKKKMNIKEEGRCVTNGRETSLVAQGHNSIVLYLRTGGGGETFTALSQETGCHGRVWGCSRGVMSGIKTEEDLMKPQSSEHRPKRPAMEQHRGASYYWN